MERSSLSNITKPKMRSDVTPRNAVVSHDYDRGFIVWKHLIQSNPLIRIQLILHAAFLST